VQDACSAGLDPAVSLSFASAGWGWHLETGTHALHLILAGVFDQYPSLQLILGHWGEMVPFSLARVDEAVSPPATHLQRRVGKFTEELTIFALKDGTGHFAIWKSRSRSRSPSVAFVSSVLNLRRRFGETTTMILAGKISHIACPPGSLW
jgi:Amidohydrolase